MKVAGVSYEIDWRLFQRGSSIFFPCLDAREAWYEIRPVLRRLDYKVAKRREVIGGVMGLRIWRV